MEALRTSICYQFLSLLHLIMKSAKRILLVEDEENLLNTIKLNLELEGHNVDGASDGATGLNLSKKNKYDLIILDVMLPIMNGYDVCAAMRHEDAYTPIMFLTAKGSGEERVQGLKIGADDYLTKPFNLEELILRVDILLNRGKKPSNTPTIQAYSFGDNEVNFSTYYIVNHQQQKFELSKREIELLQYLISRKGEVVSREDILDNIWGAETFPSSRTIDNYILAFRKYFEKEPKNPVHFHSIRGVGYKFTD